jgi:hypothetical protein
MQRNVVQQHDKCIPWYPEFMAPEVSKTTHVGGWLMVMPFDSQINATALPPTGGLLVF